MYDVSEDRYPSDDEADLLVDLLERYANLLAPIRARGPLTPSTAQLLGPVMATLQALGLCAELLALSGGLSAADVREARRRSESPEAALEEDSMAIVDPQAALSHALSLKQLAIQDVAVLAELAAEALSES